MRCAVSACACYSYPLLTRQLRRYEGPSIGAAGLSLMRQWAALDKGDATAAPSPFVAPPANWVPPFGAGFQASEGAQPLGVRAWRAAGKDDESYFDRPMTDAELKEQEQSTLSESKAIFDKGTADNDPNMF